MIQKKAKKKGRPPKKLDPEKVIQRAVQLATGEVNVNYEGKDHLVKGSEMTRDMNTFLRERTGMMAKEFYERVTAKLENLVDTLANDLAEKHDKIPPQSLAVALGIMLDKVNLSGVGGILTSMATISPMAPIQPITTPMVIG